MSSLDRLRAALGDRYRIEKKLGQGGMAVVYLAEDLKHHRRVAVKVLHPDLSAILGPERFHKEIELTAALQHPHILPLFDSGSADGLLYYVMPYVEGETLRTRLTRQVQLSVPEAVRIASEVADALEYAHRYSVIHRDIKPENILLRDNHALVMDFGIALAVAQAGDRLTQTGTSLGTPQYMAPEQASGDRHVDGRVDVYALGVVTYEMLVGEPPFTGPTVQAIMAKVMTQEPRPISVTRKSVPEQIEAAVLTALQKVPADRFATPGEFQRALVGNGPTTVRATRSQVPASTSRRTWAWGAVTAAVAVVAFLLGSSGSGARSPLAGFGLATKVTWERGLEVEPALSPDGKSVAYAAGTNQRMRIYVRQVSGGRPVELTGEGTTSQTNPQWSPDGTRIYFVTDSGMSSAPAAGGSARPEMRPPGGAVVSAAMSPDGATIAFAMGDSLYLHNQNGENRLLAPLREASLCKWAPSGRVVACASGNSFYSRLGNLYGNIASSRIVTVRVSDGAVTPVAEGPWTNQSPAWSGDGRWLYYVSNRLGPLDIYAAPVSSDGKPAGPVVRLTTGLGAHEISVSRTRFAYDNFTAAANLWMMPFPPANPTAGQALTTGSQVIESMSASRDGEWVYYNSDVNGRSEIYRLSLSNPLLSAVGPGDPEQITFDSIDDFAPAPSPDGRSVAFHSFRTGSRDIYVMPLDGGPVAQVTNSPRQEGQASWSPDGHVLTYTEYGVVGAVWLVHDSGAGWGTPVRASPYGAWPAISPDGRSLAFASNSLGGSLIVMGPGKSDHRVVVDSVVGHLVEGVHWSPDGQTLYFKSHDSEGRAEFWSVPRTGGAPKLLVRLGLDRPSDRPEWAIGNGRMFFAVNDRQSDIWVMEAIPN